MNIENNSQLYFFIMGIVIITGYRKLNDSIFIWCLNYLEVIVSYLNIECVITYTPPNIYYPVVYILSLSFLFKYIRLSSFNQLFKNKLIILIHLII